MRLRVKVCKGVIAEGNGSAADAEVRPPLSPLEDLMIGWDRALRQMRMLSTIDSQSS